jgi:hypothetical protein
MAAVSDTSSSSAGSKAKSQTLHTQYPMTSSWEFTLQNGENIKGEIYCTDPVADLVVLRDQVNDIRMVSVASIQESKQVKEASGDPSQAETSMAHTKKALEEREKRAIRLAQESLRHLNPKVSNQLSRIMLHGSGI